MTKRTKSGLKYYANYLFDTNGTDIRHYHCTYWYSARVNLAYDIKTTTLSLLGAEI